MWDMGRNVERKIPADPGNPESHEIVEGQAGQVWFPDSAYKPLGADTHSFQASLKALRGVGNGIRWH